MRQPHVIRHNMIKVYTGRFQRLYHINKIKYVRDKAVRLIQANI